MAQITQEVIVEGGGEAIVKGVYEDIRVGHNGEDNDNLYVGSKEESETHSLDFISEDDEELINIRKKRFERKDGKYKKNVGVFRRDVNEMSVPTHEGGRDEYGSDYAASDEY